MWQLLSQVSSQIEHPVLSGWGGGGGEGRGMEYRRHSAGSVAELKLLETRRCGSVHLGAVLVD